MMNSDDEYKFNPERKYQGLALVVVNFTSGRYEREGSKNDVKYLKKTFKRLGFKVALFQNLSSRKFIRLLGKYSQDKVLRDYDSFAFAISTHGVEVEKVDGSERNILVHHHAVEMFDGSYVYTKMILDYFSPRKCRALRGKPKLFFIQACRIPQSTSTDEHRAVGFGFDAGASPSKLYRVSGGRLDKVDSSDRRGGREPNSCDGGEPDRCDGGEPDRHDGGEPDRTNLEADDTVSDTDVDDDSDMEDDVDFPAVTSEASHDSNSVENEQTEDMLDPAERGQLQASIRRVGSGDFVDVGGVRYTPVQAPVHITAVPCHDDMLIMFASPQGHYAVRNGDTGSYMLQFLYDSVKTVYGEGRFVNNRTNFLHVLNDVAYKMSSDAYFDEGYKNVTCVVHKLSKDIIFSKGENMQHTIFSLVLRRLTEFVTGN